MRKQKKQVEQLALVHPNAAGLDIGAREIWACMPVGADWIIHNDADEFWWPVTGNLKEALEAIPDQYGMVVAPRTEFVPRPDGPGTFAERLVRG